mmetsp:Transcript_16566/g.24919  ORF Transcript_16566/g.24919 Transcript_16566/m.24919 type:complete len:298 (+) Transcript_16566:40-933(+)|eukprot:CAMPEP_0185025122 /NCGR_PEP_ID=MMETSP1103-20130426/8199_1 /TAXON_ID=36769 /ORGANISM="Paraphysomonas bandaiensis, Strain Caron Lab Isolate" /LENGTH=297 /DNA_ID=CAMNT_0027558249 /DNA_START=34 /DNA_END=930 /DNA_ORIENTATION=-
MAFKIKKSVVHTAVCSVVSLTIVVLVITLLAVTVNREVGQEEIVVPYDTYSMKFYGTKEQGKYTTGVGVKWYTFKRNLRNLNVGKISCLSNDKIEMVLDVKIQIIMDKDALKRVVLKQFKNGDGHTEFLRFVARSSIISTCLNYTAEEYYSERRGIDAAMFENLQRDINDYDFGATVEFFQLETITLPDALIDVITEKQNIEQDIVTARNDRQNAIITATTALLKAEQSAHVTVIEANNTAVIVRNRALQTESIIQTEWGNRAIAYQSIVDGLDLDEEEFLEYLNSELLRQSSRVIA